MGVGRKLLRVAALLFDWSDDGKTRRLDERARQIELLADVLEAGFAEIARAILAEQAGLVVAPGPGEGGQGDAAREEGD